MPRQKPRQATEQCECEIPNWSSGQSYSSRLYSRVRSTFIPNFSLRVHAAVHRRQYRNRWEFRPSCSPFGDDIRMELDGSRRRCRRSGLDRGAGGQSSTSWWQLKGSEQSRFSLVARLRALQSLPNQAPMSRQRLAKLDSPSSDYPQMVFTIKRPRSAAGSASDYGLQPSNMIWSAQRAANLRSSSPRTVHVSNGSPNTLRASRGAAAGKSLTE